jgi:anti-sigma factor RsiW
MIDRHLTDDELQSYLDGDPLSDREWVENHLRVCDRCREELARYEQLYMELAKDVGHELSPDFADSVISRVPERPAPHPRWQPAHILALILGAIAGLSALVYFVGLKEATEFIVGVGARSGEAAALFYDAALGLLFTLNVDAHLFLYAVLILVFVVTLDHILPHWRKLAFRAK